MAEILRKLSKRHEVHLAAYERDYNTGGDEHSRDYCSRLHRISPPGFPGQLRPFALQVLREEFYRLPPNVRALTTARMRETIARLTASENFDVVVADSCYMAANIPDLPYFVLFQQNVESLLIGRRLEVETGTLLRRAVRREERQMYAHEQESCRRAAAVIAISEQDAKTMEKTYGLSNVTPIHTGVDAARFAPAAEPSDSPATPELVFMGAMSWDPNIDAVRWFVSEILPRIHARRPETTFAIVGHSPGPEICSLQEKDSRITVTGTVEDVRPWLWGGKIFAVPLRYGSGVRIKIFEAMAAGIPIVSTPLGAEGLAVNSPEHLLLEGDPDGFANACLRLLTDENERRRMRLAAQTLVRDRFTWDNTAAEVEAILHKVAQSRRR